jgi:hypothetical protein
VQHLRVRVRFIYVLLTNSNPNLNEEYQMKKVVSLMAVLTFACMLFAQVNINSTTNVQNGNNYSDGLLVTNQYTGTQLDRYGIKATSLQ